MLSGKYKLEWFKALMDVKFREIHGCVLAFIPGLHPPRENKCSSLEERAIHENMENHQHFEYDIGETPWERWQNNLALCVTVQNHWTLKLRQQFPDRDFVMFIYNETQVSFESLDEEKPVGIEIIPTLRMWSKDNDPDLSMFKGFHVKECSNDLIEIRVNYRPSFVHSDRVFTKTGFIRKRFFRENTANFSSSRCQ